MQGWPRDEWNGDEGSTAMRDDCFGFRVSNLGVKLVQFSTLSVSSLSLALSLPDTGVSRHRLYPSSRMLPGSG